MTAGSMAMSRTAPITRVRRHRRLRPIRPRRRPRLSAAASADKPVGVMMSDLRTGGVPQPVRVLSTLNGVAVALLAAASPFAFAAPAEAAATVAVSSTGGQGISDFYAARSGMPLWFE